MPRAAGPYKILEKINDNAYKLELPPEFRSSPTLNIADLKPYLGQEDELESRTTQMQEGEDDEDINTTPTPSPAPLGPITRARARELNHQVSSFSNSCPLYLDNGDTCTLVLIRNNGEDQQDKGWALAGFGLQDSTNL